MTAARHLPHPGPAAPPGRLRATAHVRRGAFSLDVEVAVEPGTVVTVVGPNGAGKSTLLRLLAGLPVAGTAHARLHLGDRDLGPRPASERPIGVAFQDLRLFPHLSAVDNVAFPLRARGVPRAEARAEAAGELGAVGLDAATQQRRPAALSGGEAQRVALARALVARPDVLLLDEPFAAVDAEYRGRARAALAARLAEFAGVVLVVTHDAADALLLGDEVLVLEDGAVTQHATAREVARHPASRYAANLVGTNLWRGTRSGGAVTTAAGTPVVVADTGPAGPVGLIVAPTAVALHPSSPAGTPRNVWPATVSTIELLGGRARVVLELDTGDELVAEVTLAAVDALDLAAGRPVWASVKATEITVLDDLRP